MNAAPRETTGPNRTDAADLFTGDTALDFENWLLTRLDCRHLFVDPPALTADARKDRVRALLVTRDLEWAQAGKGPAQRGETWGDVFRRIYGEPLVFAPPPKTPRGPKVGLDR